MAEDGLIPARGGDDAVEPSLLGLGNLVLRRRRVILALAVACGLWGGARAILGARLYVSTATIVPQGPEATSQSGLAAAASQLGIRVPSASGSWGPPIYVELLRSQSLLESVALDTVVVVEKGGRRVALPDLLGVRVSSPDRRADVAVRALRLIVTAEELRQLNAVRISVRTRWPSVSRAIAERLVQGLNAFNVETRKSQAAVERQFVEGQAAEAERVLREAEDRLQAFLQRNREIAGSPDLTFQQDRLQREVALRQQAYTSLVLSREDARIREVRDTPVLTVLQPPRLPLVAEPRGAARKAFMGGLAGAVVGFLLAVVLQGLQRLRRDPTEASQEFFRLLEDAMPSLLRRRAP